MANTASSLSANGSLTISGSFDEVTYNPSSNVRVNTLSNSQQFNLSPWSVSLSTVTANVAVAPDGSTTAFSLNENTTTGEHLIFQSRTGRDETMTGSYYAKAGSRTRCYISLSNFLNFSCQVHYDLIAGTITFVSGNNSDYTNVSGTITPVGNGWFRCTLTATKGSVNNQNNFTIASVVGSSSVYLGTGVPAIYIWGAQYEIGTQATPYVRTGTNAITLYSNNASKLLNISSNNSIMFTGGEIDEVTYNPIANVAINLFNYTQDFSNAYWNNRLTITSANALAPDNTFTATLFTYNLVFAFIQNSTNFNITNTFGKTYTFSCYVKATTTYIALVTATSFCNFNMSAGTADSPSVGTSKITKEANGFYRCSVTFTSASTAENFSIWLGGFNGSVWTGQTMTVWGPQVEVNSVVTPYQAKGASGLLQSNTAMKTTNTGNTFIKSTFDEVTGNLPVTNGLILYMDPMKLESYPESGTTAYDLSSSKNIISLSNVTYNSNGYFDYNGYNSWANTTYTQPIWQTSDNFTWNIWYRPTRNTTEIILGNRYSFNFTTDYLQFVKLTSSGWEYYNPAGQQGVNSFSPLNVWQNAALVKNGSTLTYYRNGVSIGTSTITSNMTVTNPFYIGGISEYFKGSIGVVNVYNRALSLSEVQENFNGLRNRYGI